jgi:hypothetical protein
MKEDLDEDIFDLENVSLFTAWNNQPGLYWTYAKKLADAKEALERAESRCDVVLAELDQDIRTNPEDYKIGKLTEPAVKNAVRGTGGYKEASDSVIKAKHKVDVLSAFVKALDHRKSALEARVQLEIHGLHAEPKPPKGEEAREKVDHMRKQEIRNRSKIK